MNFQQEVSAAYTLATQVHTVVRPSWPIHPLSRLIIRPYGSVLSVKLN